MVKSKGLAYFSLVAYLLVACGPGSVPLDATAHPTPQPTSTFTPAPANSPVAPSTATSTPAPPSATPGVEVCSPLEGVSLEDLSQTITNPYHPPPPGSDDPHQGVDFADLRPGDSVALEGRPVRAVLSGRVAGVVAGRFPYGNALLVETAFSDLTENWLDQLGLPAPIPTLEPRSALTCPAWEYPPDWEPSRRSLYLLYAHLRQPPQQQPGDGVQCGQRIGAIGASGNALNPHLHLEGRVGPAGARFDSLAHYDPGASAEEMANYCTWRVSGWFQTIDPMRLFTR